MIDSFLAGSLPLWQVFLIAFLVLGLAGEIGHRLGTFRAAAESGRTESSFGVATSAILGLLAFLLAFTLSTATVHFSERRNAALAEANAIGTAYLRADLLPAERGQNLERLLRQYVALRLEATKSGGSAQNYIKLVEDSEELHLDMWQIAMNVAPSEPTPTHALVLSSLNEVFDHHGERVAFGLSRRTPRVIWVSSLALAGISMGAMSYRTAAMWRHRSELGPALAAAFAGIVTLIADLDSPRTGYLLSDQSPIQRLEQSLMAHNL